MTDFRALCAELMDAIDSGISVERIKHSPLAVRVDAALAQPEPQGPTDEGIMQHACTSLGYEYTPSLLSEPENGIGSLDALPSELLTFARAVLTRWGRPVIEPVPQQTKVNQ